MAIGYERDYEDEVYEDEYYEEHFDEELIDEEAVEEEEFEDEEISDDEDSERDADEEGEYDDPVAARESERKIEVSYACDDCDYRWEDVIIKRKEVLHDYDDEHDIICPMCGSVNISII